jgi:hypothetical protein
MDLSDLCETAHAELAKRPVVEFEVLIAFKNAPHLASGYPPGWMKAAAVSSWLRQHGYDVKDIRPSGGLTLKVSARDPDAASQGAADRIDHFTARASLASAATLEPWPMIWVKGEPQSFSYGHRPRGVRVKALYRESQVLTESTDSAVDAAIELLAHLENSSPSAAIAGGWAAVEALLAEPNDRAAAADSFAAVVACSFPRAELTALSYTAEKHCPDLEGQLAACKENRDRSLILARAIAGGHSLNLHKHVDQAARVRMEKLLHSPSKSLADIQVHIADTFHRLYRQRNLILHGGKTNAVALRGSYLIRIDRIEVLPKLYGRILTPALGSRRTTKPARPSASTTMDRPPTALA